MDDHAETVTPINLLQSFADAVHFLAAHARGALVYVDSGASEALGHFTSYAKFIALGAVHVCHVQGARGRTDAATAARLNAGTPVWVPERSIHRFVCDIGRRYVYIYIYIYIDR